MGYFLFGLDTFGIDERIVQLRHAIDPSNLSTTVIDVQSSTLQEISAACQTAAFFGTGRLVILRDPIAVAKRGEQQDDAEAEAESAGAGRIRWPELMDVLKRAQPTTTITLRHQGALSPGHYARKAIKALGWTEESFAIPRGHVLLEWVIQRANRLQYLLEPDAAIQLLNLLYPDVWQRESRWDTVTPDLRVIAIEIEKLASASSDGRVGPDLVRDLVADRGGYKAFALNEAAFSGHRDAALVELDHVLEAGESAERILAQASSESTTIAAARHVREFGAGAVATAAGTSEGRLSTLGRKQLPTQTSTLRRIAESVRNADAAVKTGHAERVSATITPLIAEVAETVRQGPGSGRPRS